MNHLVLSTSLSPTSRSRILARAAYERLPDSDSTQWMDLQDEGLPLCDGGPSADDRVDRLRRGVAQADGILIAFGIYNYLAPAATKNILEWAGRASFEGKVVAFAAVGGGPGSLPSVASLTTPMLLDFGAVVCPSFVYTTGASFADDALVDPNIESRLDEFVSTWTTLTQRVRAGDQHA
ncbi:MAG: flavoprotein [Phycisphaerae bacterium]|nr:flavoprotein [Phycisphaerae bacterium]